MIAVLALYLMIQLICREKTDEECTKNPKSEWEIIHTEKQRKISNL